MISIEILLKSLLSYDHKIVSTPQILPKNDEKNPIRPNQIAPSIHVMRDRDTSTLMGRFQYSSLVVKPFDQCEIGVHQRAFKIQDKRWH